jgi:hypothetical protein
VNRGGGVISEDTNLAACVHVHLTLTPFPIIIRILLVQLGGLEPPTSCSTGRRSNQLSYNCILCAAPKRGHRTGRKLGATPVFGKAGGGAISAIGAHQRRTQSKKPGLAARAFL